MMWTMVQDASLETELYGVPITCRQVWIATVMETSVVSRVIDIVLTSQVTCFTPQL